MTTAPPSSPPKVGDVFCRDDEHMGRYEAVVVFRNVRDGGHWDAMLVTNENFFPLSSSRFAQSIHHGDWRPVTWKWSPEAFMFAPANVKWNPEAQAWNTFAAVEVEEEPEEQLPPKSALPKPRDTEHHATWRARCRRKFPMLDSDDGNTLLGEAWNDFKSKE